MAFCVHPQEQLSSAVSEEFHTPAHYPIGRMMTLQKRSSYARCGVSLSTFLYLKMGRSSDPPAGSCRKNGQYLTLGFTCHLKAPMCRTTFYQFLGGPVGQADPNGGWEALSALPGSSHFCIKLKSPRHSRHGRE